jgi:polysaccharide pyruvyl transferase WcaK-like protein
MNVLVDNGLPELTNLGDLAMLMAACRGIRRRWPGARIFTFATRPERLSAVLPDVAAVDPAGRELWSRAAALGWLAETKVPRMQGPARIFRGLTGRPSLAPLIKLAARGDEPPKGAISGVLHFLREVDLYFWAGGGYLADPFGSLATKLANTLEALSRRRVPAAAFGLGVGPLHRPRILRTVRTTMRNLCAIGVRETRSFELLQGWSLDGVDLCLTGDDAIAGAFAERPPEPGDALGLSLRLEYYSEFNDRHLAVLKRVVREFCTQHRAGMISVPIAPGDLGANAKLRACDVPFEEPAFGLAPVYAAIRRCRVVVTACYHAAVFALSMGIPAIGLASSDYYVQKFRGLQKQFGGVPPLISCREHTPSEAFRDELRAVLAGVWSDAPRIRPKLLANATAQIDANDIFRERVFERLQAQLR